MFIPDSRVYAKFLETFGKIIDKNLAKSGQNFFKRQNIKSFK